MIISVKRGDTFVSGGVTYRVVETECKSRVNGRVDITIKEVAGADRHELGTQAQQA